MLAFWLENIVVQLFFIRENHIIARAPTWKVTDDEILLVAWDTWKATTNFYQWCHIGAVGCPCHQGPFWHASTKLFCSSDQVILLLQIIQIAIRLFCHINCIFLLGLYEIAQKIQTIPKYFYENQFNLRTCLSFITESSFQRKILYNTF